MAEKEKSLTSELAAVAREALADIPADVFGLFGGDWLHQKRKLNLLELEKRFERLAKEKGLKPDPIAASPSIVLAIIAAAQDEDREALQELWARLLAAATDPRRAHSVRKSFIEIVKQFDPFDALVLDALGSIGTVPNAGVAIAQKLNRAGDEVIVSFINLERLGLVACAPHAASIDIGQVHIRVAGKELLRAVK
ncbi:Abi-alpha family protein [Rhodoplanes sp. Z2-YC6860]|uniref:Abi-alpha family protein n=1 Tax=Rhodoplanes sp. Z2-YC6860 TaxID=674703 RepID=UPI00078BE490|nr:Abi-alpha family protein [Rhodoplanes sp. Z2-YC6860]AMN42072.1 hypothetical protein RHPLAN_36400 [Rhodoplanes sp. Z2-YC6860]